MSELKWCLSQKKPTLLSGRVLSYVQDPEEEEAEEEKTTLWRGCKM